MYFLEALATVMDDKIKYCGENNRMNNRIIFKCEIIPLGDHYFLII